MTRLDNDLISRKALLEAFKKQGYVPAIVENLITNAPTIEADSGEAVAWVGYKPQSNGTYFPVLFLEKPKPIGLINIEPLYTSPPKRQWVNLDPFEVDALISTPPKDDIELAQLVRKIQAKLKELNHG